MSVQLYEGCYGVTRGGKIEGAIHDRSGGEYTSYAWSGVYNTYTRNGQVYASGPADPADIIAVFPTRLAAEVHLRDELVPASYARLAVALVVEKAAGVVSAKCDDILSKQDGKSAAVDQNLRLVAVMLPDLATAILALADTDALAEGQKLRAERDAATEARDAFTRALSQPTAGGPSFVNAVPVSLYEAARAEAAEARADAAVKLLGRAQRALKPFADRVFNDNGDCTISDTHTLTPSDYWNAQAVERMARAAIGGAA